MSRYINYGRIADQFYGALVAGVIQGVRPCAALTTDVHRLHWLWANRNELPATASPSWMRKYIASRHGVQVARKRYAEGGFILGPHSIMYMAGPIRAPFGMEVEILGRQVNDFKLMVEAYEAAAVLPEQEARVREQVR